MSVPYEKAFVYKGKRIINLNELLYELKHMNDSDYSNYVNDDNNYFTDWIYHVMGLKELSEKLRKAKSRKNTITFLEKYLDDPDKAPQPDIDVMIKGISKQDTNSLLWKHFSWDLAREFMYGLAIGILIGLIMSRILLPQ